MKVTLSSTKAELRAYIAHLEAQVIQRGNDLAELRLQLSIARRNAPTVQRQLPLHFERARSLAMSTGRAVKAG